MKLSCPHCGQHFDVDESDLGKEADCTGCGKRFVLQAPASPAPSQQPPAPGVCPYCGGEIVSGVRKCRHCGEWLEKPISMSGKKAKDPVIYVLLGLFGGAIALHNFYEGKSMLGFAKISATILGLFGVGMIAEVPQMGLLLLLPMLIIFCRNMYEITHCEKMLSE